MRISDLNSWSEGFSFFLSLRLFRLTRDTDLSLCLLGREGLPLMLDKMGLLYFRAISYDTSFVGLSFLIKILVVVLRWVMGSAWVFGQFYLMFLAIR